MIKDLLMIVGGLIGGALFIVIKNKINNLKSLKEKVKEFEAKNPGLLKKLGIFVSILFGILLVLVLVFSFKDNLANTYGAATNGIARIKFWLTIIGVLLFVMTLVKNIITGGFSITKFFGGFNLFAGPVQGKLIYYGVIFAIVAAVSLGIYHRFTQETYETNYKNQIRAEQVIVDQKTIYPTQEDSLLLGIKIFGLKIGVSIQGRPRPTITINNSKIEETEKSTTKTIENITKTEDKPTKKKKVK